VTVLHGNDWSALVPPADTTWTPTRRVSICVPAHNPTNLARVLDALALQTYPSDLIEVVIADDGSDLPIAAPKGYPFPVELVRLERTLAFGAGRARNAAASRASGDLLLFLDADIVAERQVVACYGRWFRQRSDVVVTGLCRFADLNTLTDDEFHQLVAEDGLSRHFAGQQVDDQEWREKTFRRSDDLRVETTDAYRIVIGATLAVTAEQYWAVGGFRELGIRGIEDIEFGYRAHANGAVLVVDRDAVHWHQGRRTMNLQRKAQIKLEREPYAERLLPVGGFRHAPPDPPDRPVHTVPRTVVHVSGGVGRREDVRGLVDADHLVVAADEIAEAPDGMPFVASFCDVWLPREAALSDRSIRLITSELEQRGVGVILIKAPSGALLVAMKTRAHRRICYERGLPAQAGPDPEVVAAVAASFGVWHLAASAVEITWTAELVGATEVATLDSPI
jgi:GT2 family glycosyltransferase